MLEPSDLPPQTRVSGGRCQKTRTPPPTLDHDTEPGEYCKEKREGGKRRREERGGERVQSAYAFMFQPQEWDRVEEGV